MVLYQQFHGKGDTAMRTALILFMLTLCRTVSVMAGDADIKLGLTLTDVVGCPVSDRALAGSMLNGDPFVASVNLTSPFATAGLSCGDLLIGVKDVTGKNELINIPLQQWAANFVTHGAILTFARKDGWYIKCKVTPNPDGTGPGIGCAPPYMP